MHHLWVHLVHGIYPQPAVDTHEAVGTAPVLKCHEDKLDKVSGDIFKERPQCRQRHTEEHQKQESGMGMGAGWTRRSEVSILLKT